MEVSGIRGNKVVIITEEVEAVTTATEILEGDQTVNGKIMAAAAMAVTEEVAIIQEAVAVADTQAVVEVSHMEEMTEVEEEDTTTVEEDTTTVEGAYTARKTVKAFTVMRNQIQR